MIIRYYSCDFQNAETGEWERSRFRYTMQRIETFKHVRAVEDDFVEIECEGGDSESWPASLPIDPKDSRNSDWALVRSLTGADLEPDPDIPQTTEELARLETFEAHSDEERRRKVNEIQDRMDREEREEREEREKMR